MLDQHQSLSRPGSTLRTAEHPSRVSVADTTVTRGTSSAQFGYFSEVQEIVEMAKAVKRRSDQNKIWVYVAVGWLGHEVARSKGNCVPLRDQINKQLELVNARHASLGVSWSYEKETLIVSFQ